MSTVHKLDGDLTGDGLKKYANIRSEGILSAWDFHSISDLVVAPLAFQTCELRLEELKDPGRHTWICIAPNIRTGETSLGRGRWVGLVMLKGPLTPSASSHLYAGSAKRTTDKRLELRWLSSGLYLKPAHRNAENFKVLGKAVDDFLLTHAKAECDRRGAIRALVCQLFTTTTKHVMYEAHLANGCRVIRFGSGVEELQWNGLWGSVNKNSLSESDYSEQRAALLESSQWVVL